MAWQVQESFSAGEMSPRAFPRASLPQVQSGAKTMLNAFITAYGAAQKRYGSRFVKFSDYQPDASEVGNDLLGGEAIAIPYETTTGGKYMVVLTKVASDDTLATLKVLEGYSYIGFADDQAHGPIPAVSPADNTKYNTFYKLKADGPPPQESELQDIQYFQMENKLFLLHPAHPPLVLERTVIGTAETWKYEVAPFIDTSPRVHVEGNTIGLLVNTGDFEITATSDLFVPEDEGSYWRVGGTKPGSSYSEWVKVTDYLSPTMVGYSHVDSNGPANKPGNNSLDWCGPFVTSESLAITWPTTPPVTGQVQVVTWPTTPTTALIGSLLVGTTGDLFAMVVAIGSGNSVTVKVIRGGVIGATVIHKVMGTRKGVTRDYYMRSSLSSDTPIWSTKQAWLPTGHETHFDGADGTATRGGTVFIADGIVAVTGTESQEGWRGYEVVNIDGSGYIGPTFNIGFGMSEGVGFPSVGTTHQGRAVLGGFIGPTAGLGLYSENLVVSRVGEPLDFSQGKGDAVDGFGLIARDGGPIQWIDSNRDLLVGCDRAEYRVNGIPISPTTAALIKTSSYGSSRVMPVRLGAATLYVARDGRSLYMATYSDMQDTYDVADLTDLADHLFVNESIAQLVVTTSPDILVWIRTKSGKLRVLNWKPSTKVMGWSRVETGAPDAVDWISSRPTQTEGTTHDNVWAVIQRKFGGGPVGEIQDKTYRSIESFGEIYTMDQENTYTGTALTDVLTDVDGAPDRLTIGALRGQTVQVVADGVYYGDVTMTFSADTGADVGHLGMAAMPTSLTVGRAVSYKIEPCIQETDVGRGTTHGHRRNISRILVYVQNTRGLIVEGYAMDTVPGVPASAVVPVFGGWVSVPVIGDYGNQPVITVTQTAPYQIEVCAVNMEVSYGD